MSAGTLGFAALVDAAIFLVFVVVGLVVLRRPTSSEARAASVAFGLWWLGIGASVLANALKEACVAFAVHETPAAVAALVAVEYASVAALVVAVGGLVYYLVYLFTGRRGALLPIAAFYAAYGLVALALVSNMEPSGVEPGKWFVQWAHERPQQGGGLLTLLVLLLLLPQIVGSGLYLSLRSRVAEPLARYRVTMVGSAILAWQGIQLVAPFLALGRFEWWQAGGRLVGLAAALVVLLAYLPPAAWRERLQGGS